VVSTELPPHPGLGRWSPLAFKDRGGSFRLFTMKRRLPLYLVLAGTTMLVVGTILTVALLIRRENCDGVSPSIVCQGYTNSLHWAYPIIVLGAVCFIAAGLSATNLVQRHGQKGSSVRPTARRDT
jgi:hypothetical protein